jgi:hypothetical protein
VREGIIAHRGGTCNDSKMRVKSEGLVNVIKKEKLRAPQIIRKNTPNAMVNPEKINVVPVKKIIRGIMPHNRFIIDLLPPTNKNSKIIKIVRRARGRGAKTSKSIN